MDKINPLVITSNSEKENTGTPSSKESLVVYRIAGNEKTHMTYVTVPTDPEELSSFPVLHELAERHKVGTAAIELRGHWADLHRFERDGA